MASLPKPRLRRAPRPGGVSIPAAEPERLHIEEVSHNGFRWINVERPRSAERAWLQEEFEFHPLAYEDIYSRNQRPKLDEYPDHLFAVMHFPRFDSEIGRLAAAELDVFVGRDFLITIPNEPIDPLSYLFERCRQSEEVRNDLFSRNAGYLFYRVIDACVDAGFPMLRKIGAKLERLEDQIFTGHSAESVRDLSNAKQEIINFRKIVRPQRSVFRDLEQSDHSTISDELEIYFGDLDDASERIWQMLDGYKETVEALEVTNESILSHNLNDVLRILTVLTVIFLPPTLVAGIMGMNTHVPGEATDAGFWAAVGFVGVMLVGSLTYFKWRRWL